MKQLEFLSFKFKLIIKVFLGSSWIRGRARIWAHLPLEEKGIQYYFSWIILSLQRFGDHAYFPSDESKALKRKGFGNKSHAFFHPYFLFVDVPKPELGRGENDFGGVISGFAWGFFGNLSPSQNYDSFK